MSKGHSKSVIIYALLANLGIAGAKLIGAYVTLSSALVAEGIHSLVDCSNQLLLLLGLKLSQKPATKKHPLGYGKEAFFWSFMVAILLFSMGGIFSIYEGLRHLEHSESVVSPIISFSILAVGFVLELFSFMACLKEVRVEAQGMPLWQWFRKTTTSELLVIFIEDLAALMGLFIAGVAVGISWYTGDSAWDGYGAMAVGVLLVCIAVVLAVEVKSLIIGETSSKDFELILKPLLKKYMEKGSLLNVIALQLGPHEVMLAIKFSPPLDLTVSALMEKMNEFESEIKVLHKDVRWIFLEPDSRN
jgi:cation diffusion facilitator family transporter